MSIQLAIAERNARLGKMLPRVTYIDRVVERVVEKVVEKIVEVQVPHQGPHVCARCCEEIYVRAPEIKEIIEVVARRYGLTLAEIRGPSRVPHVVRPRQTAMYLAKILHPTRSLSQIARMFGDRDHTTILHSVQKIARLMREDEQFAAEVEAIKSTI